MSAAFCLKVKLVKPYLVGSAGAGSLVHSVRAASSAAPGGVTDTLSFHFPDKRYLTFPSLSRILPFTPQRPVPNMLHSVNLMLADAPVVRLLTCMSPKVSIQVRPTSTLFTRDGGGQMLYTSPLDLSLIRVRPCGHTSTQLPMNFVLTAEVRS